MIKNFKLFLNENKKQQSIPNGTEVTFDLNGVSSAEFDLDDETHDSDWWERKLDELDGKKAIIECLATYTELGDKNLEYYDIEFGDGTILYAISGYHLTSTSNKSINKNDHSISQTFNVYWTLKADESEAQGEEDIENIVKLSELLVDLIADEKVDNDSIRIETEG